MVVQIDPQVVNALTRKVTIWTDKEAVWIIVGDAEAVCYKTAKAPINEISEYKLQILVKADTAVIKFRRARQFTVGGGSYEDPGKKYTYVNVYLHPDKPTATVTSTVTQTPTKSLTPTSTETYTPVVIP